MQYNNIDLIDLLLAKLGYFIYFCRNQFAQSVPCTKAINCTAFRKLYFPLIFCKCCSKKICLSAQVFSYYTTIWHETCLQAIYVRMYY